MYTSIHAINNPKVYTEEDIYSMDRFAFVEEAYVTNDRGIIMATLANYYEYRLVAYRTWIDSDDNTCELHLIVCNKDIDPSSFNLEELRYI